MDEILRLLHSWTRWLFLGATLVGIVFFAVALVRQSAWEKRAQTLLTVFSSTLGLQWIIGLLFLLWLGFNSSFGVRHYWEHLFVQTIALGVAHMHFGWRKREMPDARRYRNGLLLMLGVVALTVIGIFTLPSFMQWRFYLPA